MMQDGWSRRRRKRGVVGMIPLIMLMFIGVGDAVVDGNPNVAALHRADRDCQVSEWSDWTGCNDVDSVLGGVATRTRNPTAEQGQGKECNSAVFDAQLCSSLGYTTPDGFTIPDGAIGTTQEILNVTTNKSELPDCELGEWGPWGGCSFDRTSAGSRSCGYSYEARLREPANAPCRVSVDIMDSFNDCSLPDAPCFANLTDQGSLVESRLCPVAVCDIDCVVSTWSVPTACGPNCAGVNGSQTRSRQVLSSAGGAGVGCPVLRENRTCMAACSVECQVSNFSKWGQCVPIDSDGDGINDFLDPAASNFSVSAVLRYSSDSVSNGSNDSKMSNASNNGSVAQRVCAQNRTRTVLTQPQGNAQPCPGLWETQVCSCPGGGASFLPQVDWVAGPAMLSQLQTSLFGCSASGNSTRGHLGSHSADDWRCSSAAGVWAASLSLLTSCGVVLLCVWACISGRCCCQQSDDAAYDDSSDFEEDVGCFGFGRSANAAPSRGPSPAASERAISDRREPNEEMHERGALLAEEAAAPQPQHDRGYYGSDRGLQPSGEDRSWRIRSHHDYQIRPADHFVEMGDPYGGAGHGALNPLYGREVGSGAGSGLFSSGHNSGLHSGHQYALIPNVGYL